MSSKPSYFRIHIAGGSPPLAEGFVDNRTATQYLANTVGADGSHMASLDNLPAGFSYPVSLAMTRANLRYAAVVAQLGLICNIYLQNTVATGGSATTAATSVSFDALIEHGNGALATWDETSPGTLLTNTVSVLTRAIARALIQNTTVKADVLDPTANTSVGVLGASKAVPRFGMRSAAVTVDPPFATLAAASNAITVTALF